MEVNYYMYTIEKFTDALRNLAILPGDVRERLVVAHQCFHTLQECDFSPHLLKDWRWINRQLTKFGPILDHKGRVQEGSVQHTMRRIRRATGGKIAKKIYEIYWEISNNIQYA